MYFFYLLALIPMALAYTGEMTYYNTGVGSCGATSADTDKIVALSVAKMNNGVNPNNNPLCFKHITITNSNGVSQDATIVDTCTRCAQDAIDVSPALFEALAPLSSGRVTVSWDGIGI